jgi:hypothetical protein
MPTETTTTYHLTGSELAATADKIDAVNKRCARLGLPEITLTSTPLPVWCWYTEHGRMESTEPKPAPWFRMTMHDTVITGGRPRLDGYELLAAVEFLAGGAVVSTVPGLDASTVDRDTLTPGRCDHCEIDRGRVKVYLVRETATDRTLQVGTTCARDYLGMSVTPIFATITPCDDDEEGWALGRGGRADAPTVIAVAAALADVRARGFVPASAFDRTPTKDTVRATLWPTGRMDDGGVSHDEIDACIADAEKIITHFAGAEVSGDFEHNLQAIARSEWITEKQVGLIAAMPSAYDRAIGRIQARDARDAERAASQYIGTVGTKMAVTGTVRQTVELPAFSYYGPKPVLVVLATTDGNLVCWKTTAAIRNEIEVGQTLTLEGPVKAHEDRGYGRQTVLGGKGGRVKATIVVEATGNAA